MTLPTVDRLTTLGDARTFLGAEASEDALLKLLIGQVSALIAKSLCRTHILNSNSANPITEYYGGEGNANLILRQWPASNPTVWEDEMGYFGRGTNAFASVTQLTEGINYVLRYDQTGGGASNSGILERLNGVWPGGRTRDSWSLAAYPVPGRGNIKVRYTVGWDAAPGDLSLAALLALARIRNSRAYGEALAQERYEDYSYQLAKPMQQNPNGFLGGEIGAILARYRITGVGTVLT